MPRPLVVARELTLLAGGFACYELGRHLARGQRADALDHAVLVHRAEAWLHLPSEAALQAAVASAPLFRAADVYYVSMHWVVVVAFLAWGLWRRPFPEYAWARNLLVLQTAGALVLHAAFPLAPPRMFPDWGFVDTMATYGPSAYDGGSGGFADQYAAMPSLHVGWAVLIAFVVARTGPRWVAVLAAGWATTTLLVVVVTANHWWLDAAVGVLLLVAADRLCMASGRSVYRGPMTDQDDAETTVKTLLDRYGTTYAEDAGIRLDDKPAALWQLLVLSLLLSARITAEIAVAAARELNDAGCTTPERTRDTTWQQRVDALGRGSYRRYDERTATQLGELADTVAERYSGDLRKLHEETEDLERDLQQFNGIGPAGAAIFCREVQGVWDDVAPYVDDLAAKGARRLDLPTSPDELAALVPRRDLPRLVAACVRAARQQKVVDELNGDR